MHETRGGLDYQAFNSNLRIQLQPPPSSLHEKKRVCHAPQILRSYITAQTPHWTAPKLATLHCARIARGVKTPGLGKAGKVVHVQPPRFYWKGLYIKDPSHHRYLVPVVSDFFFVTSKGLLFAGFFFFFISI